MNAHKSIAVFLTLAAVSTIFASCNNSDSSISSDTNKTSIAEPSIATETKEVAEYQDPGVNYDGADIPFYVCHYNAPYQICKYDTITSDDDTGDFISEAIIARNRNVEELLNVNISSYRNSNGNADGEKPLTTSILSGDGAYDVALLWQRKCAALLGNANYLLDLHSIQSLNMDASWVNQNINEVMTLYDRQYLLLGDICMYNMMSAPCLFFSKTLIQNNDLTDPYQLVYDGNWTIDALLSLCRQVSVDTNGDGSYSVEDTFGMNASSTAMMLAIRAAGIQHTQIDANGNPQIALNTERTITVIDKFTSLLSDTTVNLVPSNFSKYATDTGDVWVDVILPMFKNDQLLFTFNWVFYGLELRDMETDFGLVPFPKYDEQQTDYYTYLSDNWTDCLMVPSTCSDPERIGNVLNAMGYYSQQLIYPEVVERTVYNKTTRDEKASDMLDIIYKGFLFDMNDFYLWDNLSTRDIWSACVNSGSNQFASKFAAIATSMETKMQATFEALRNNSN